MSNSISGLGGREALDPRRDRDDAFIGPPTRPQGKAARPVAERDLPQWHAPLLLPASPRAAAEGPRAEHGALSNGNVEPSRWPAELLDRQATALRAQLRQDAYPGREDDVHALAQIEAEITRRQKTDHTPQVELCKRPANIPVLKQLGAEHHWIRTSHVEAGMGPKAGGVPGKDSHVDMPGDPTSVNDHLGEGAQGADCKPVKDVDEACVEKELQIGRDTGPWTPMNQCQTFAAEVLEKCSTKKDDHPVVLPTRKPIEPKL